MGVTSNPNDPGLTRGVDQPDTPFKPQADVYLVMDQDERAKREFVRPVRHAYWHTVCNRTTTMGRALAETYATDPGFYQATYCAHCGHHRPVGENGEFYWCDPDNIAVRDTLRQPKVGT